MAKGIMTIDGQRVSFDGEKNVLSVIRKAGIEMPTFCYHSDLSTYGACRMCVVEDGRGKIDASCSIDIVRVKGVKNALFGGEGLFNTVVTGPGRVMLQTMPLSGFASAIASVLPKSSS